MNPQLKKKKKITRLNNRFQYSNFFLPFVDRRRFGD